MRPVIFAVLCGVAVLETIHSVPLLDLPIFECYNSSLVSKDNLLPHTMTTLIEIIRKIEDSKGLNMDMANLVTSIIFRFRQDGIVMNPDSPQNVNTNPYIVDLALSYRDSIIKKVIGQNYRFPNDSLTLIERCTLHSMISTSIEMYERGDETRTCNKVNAQSRGRYRRNVTPSKLLNKMDDVENLTVEQMDMLSKHGNEDPNSKYPAYSRNHPRSAPLVKKEISKCPVETGVIYTEWGPISGGPVLAGIAAAMHLQSASVKKLFNEMRLKNAGYSSEKMSWTNKWMATLSGSVAETAIQQGPEIQNGRYEIDIEGHWNSTLMPKWYFLHKTEKLQFTKAEINGDLDGLILANALENINDRYFMKLSQVLDMYYGGRSFYNERACNRRKSFKLKDELYKEGYSAADHLMVGIALNTITSGLDKYVNGVVDQLMQNLGTTDSIVCPPSGTKIRRPAVNLTIVVDTSIPQERLLAILTQLLERIEVGKYNSEYTILNAKNGEVILPSSSYISNLYNITASDDAKYSTGFEFSLSLDKIISLKQKQLDNARRDGWGGGKSDAVVFIPYQQTIFDGTNNYITENLKNLKENLPDTTLLFLVNGREQEWSKYVQNSDTDIFGYNSELVSTVTLNAIDRLAHRIKYLPRRMVNSRCGSNFDGDRNANPFKDYVEPNGINYYRIHPNYFFTDSDEDINPIIKIKSNEDITVCNADNFASVNETHLNSCSFGKMHTISVRCDQPTISECSSRFFSISAESNLSSFSLYQDSVPRRFPDMTEYTVSYEDLVCRSHAGTIRATTALLSVLLVYLFL